MRSALEESLTPIDLGQLADVARLRADLDEKAYPTIVRAIEMFRDLDVVPPTPAKMLGYFGVVESLLSHAPKPNDSADSIARQLKRNLILLNNRMGGGQKLGLEEFGDTKHEKVITKLYEYRSAIAHGGDWTAKGDALVKIHDGWDDAPTGPQKHVFQQSYNAKWPERFLRRLTKRVLVHSMREPKLVVDLKG